MYIRSDVSIINILKEENICKYSKIDDCKVLALKKYGN